MSTQQTIVKKTDLELFFLNDDEVLEDLVIDSDVEIGYLRTKAGEIIGN